MAKEIERKYLVTDTSYSQRAVKAVEITQGYISVNPHATVRVRIIGDQAFITVKGINQGATRNEWEYPIPLDDARQMIDELCGTSVISKIRHYVPHGKHTWEIDEFIRPQKGLVIAEIELSDAAEQYDCPQFIGREVTGNPEYYNSMIANNRINNSSDTTF